jgi:hypothetical protein
MTALPTSSGGAGSGSAGGAGTGTGTGTRVSFNDALMSPVMNPVAPDDTDTNTTITGDHIHGPIKGIGFTPRPQSSDSNEKINLPYRSNTNKNIKLRGTKEGSVSSRNVFDFSNIAVSSQLEQEVTLEGIIPDEKLTCYDLPSGPVTPYSVDLLIALYKKNGKLTSDSLHKILRISYKKLKQLGNMSKVSVEPGEKIVVVGDIHGAFFCCEIHVCF